MGRAVLSAGLVSPKRRFAAGDQALAHVFLRHDGSFFTKMRIAAGMVAVPVRVQHDLDRFVSDAFQRGFNLIGKWQELIIHHDDAVVAD